MPRPKLYLLKDLSTSDLKRLLATRERVDVLEAEKGKLVKELARVEKELAKLLAASNATKTTRRKPGPKKKAKKKAVRKKVSRKKVTRKSAAKAGAKKKTDRRKAGKKPVRKATGKRAVGGGRVKLEDVVVKVIRKKKGPIAFKDLYAAIVKGKLFASKSSNFDNVLRRTLSTSKLIKRVGRGIYDVA